MASPKSRFPAEQWPQHFDLYLPDGTTLMKKEDVPLYRALRGNTVQNSEMVIIPKHGTPRRLLADGRQLIADGQIVGAVVVMHDITEQRRNEKQLALFSAIIDSSHDAIIGKSLDGIVTSWNPGAEHLYGYTAAEMIGQPISMLMPPDRSGEIETLLSTVRGRRAYGSVRYRSPSQGWNSGRCLPDAFAYQRTMRERSPGHLPSLMRLPIANVQMN